MDQSSSSTMMRRATGMADLARCFAIRDDVFVGEQGVDPALERDGKDDECVHFLALIDGQPVATARVMMLGNRMKFQRVAVLPRARGTGLGAALMRFMMDDLAGNGAPAGAHFFLSSQVHAIPFYEKLGFAVCSDEYLDAGIPHKDMSAPLQAAV